MSQFNAIVQSCRYLLQSSPTAEAEACRDYLANRLSEQMQEQFSFGYFPGGSNLPLLTNFIPEAELKAMNLMYTREAADSEGMHTVSVGFFDRHPLILPYRDVYGNVIALVGRSLLFDTERTALKIPKYKNTSFIKGNHVFGLFEAKEAILAAGFVYVVEGQFDMIKATEKGLKNVVALGSTDLSAYQASLIARYTKNILLLLDNDEAGERGRGRAMKKFSTLLNVQGNVFLPAGYKDIDELLKENDASSMGLIVKDVQLDW